MINTERERLIQRSQSWSLPDVNALGALHAMCIYQIIGLLDIQNPAQIRIAELQHPYFLKLAQRLCQENLYTIINQSEYIDWETWLVKETLRRVIFLAQIVNTFARRIHPRNSSYFEALDEDLIFNLTLPAPDPMWKASTAGEWEAAKSKVGWVSGNQLTLRTALFKLGDSHPDEERHAWLADFQPLSLLIIACVRLRL